MLEAAKQLNIKIPSLCYLHMDDIDMINQCSSCRVCMVSCKKGLVPACGTVVKENMEIKTNTNEALKARKNVVELLLSDHPQDCLSCGKSGNCELQNIASDLGIRDIKFKGEVSKAPIDTSSKSIIKDHNKCILCRRCETMCNEIQTVGVLSGINRGFNTQVGTFFNTKLCNTECTFCGQCIAVCPTGALSEVNNISTVWDILNQSEKTIVVQVAPAVRVAIGEEFGLEAGSI
ncbi:MAG: 2Fe-2S iron-sulfur cluster-binding protein, partial [Cetobacterium sp.]